MTKVHIQKILALSKILQVIWENNLYKETEVERKPSRVQDHKADYRGSMIRRQRTVGSKKYRQRELWFSTAFPALTTVPGLRTHKDLMSKRQRSQTFTLSHHKWRALTNPLFRKNILCLTFFLMLNCAFGPSDTTINCWASPSSLKTQKHHSRQLTPSWGIIYARWEPVWNINHVSTVHDYSQRTEPKCSNTVCPGFPRTCRM